MPTFDLSVTPLRDFNAALHAVAPGDNDIAFEVINPRGAHALAVGIDKPVTVTVPTGVAVFPKEIVTPVRKWMESGFPNITHWSEMAKGGHFAAFEQPAAFVADVRKFFAMLR